MKFEAAGQGTKSLVTLAVDKGMNTWKNTVIYH